MSETIKCINTQRTQTTRIIPEGGKKSENMGGREAGRGCHSEECSHVTWGQQPLQFALFAINFMPDYRRTQQAPPLIDKNLTRYTPPTDAKCATGLFGQQSWLRGERQLQRQLHSLPDYQQLRLAPGSAYANNFWLRKRAKGVGQGCGSYSSFLSIS